MSIQFQCTCGTILRVDDEQAGKKARCPTCQSVVPIPMAAGSAPPINPFANTAGSAKPANSDNPYAGAQRRIKSVLSDTIAPTKVEFEWVFNRAWEIWKNNLGLLVGVTATVIGISLVFVFINGFCSEVILQITKEKVLSELFGFGFGMIGNVIQLFIGIGQVRICCDLARGRRTEFSRLFSGWDCFFPVLGASILFGIAMFFGFLLLIVPAILMGLFGWAYYFLIVDGKTKALESFSVSYQCLSINVGTTLLVWLVSMLVSFIGFCAICVGILFAAPLVSMMWTVAYLGMTGQLRG